MNLRKSSSLLVLLLFGISFASTGAVGCGFLGGGSPTNPQTGMEGDYDQMSGPSELAKLPYTNLVVSGEAGSPNEGRVWADSPNDEFGALTTTVVPLFVDKVEQGQLPTGADGTVYLEIQLAPGSEASFDSIEGREGIFYLNRLPDDLGPSNGIYPIDAEAGRPKGQPLFQPSHPEGILVEAAGGGVWSVESAVSYPNGNLDDFLPSKQSFPRPASEPAA